MTSTLASMDLCEQVTALFLGNASHEDAIGATAVEIPFYHRISLSQPHYTLSRCLVFRKDVVLQVVPDLGDPCSTRSSGPSRCTQPLADPTNGAPSGPLASRC
jgi:hypothetical protein